ncbi:hypothetical protein, partial [Salmonella sp. s51228]|uniref:hypothetical protein n=1 Tax=Salmonella sp. s51228 TaxID=3159652 RepID=UPI00397ECDE0
MDTLVNVQLVRGLPYTFSSVMNEIQRAQRAEQISYLATLLSFVNVLIVSVGDLDERNETRQEFSTLGIANILDELRFTEKEEL